jgi:DNA-binding winged helix-turn-helix (wHTH) protein
MEAVSTGEIFLFEGFRLGRRGGGLFREDERGVFAPVAIGSRALDVLVERPGGLVLKDEIMAAVWPETVVEDSNLPVQIRALRRVLDHRRAEGSCIRTVAGRGYRLVLSITRREADARSGTAAVPGNALDHSSQEGPSVCRLLAGGKWIRTVDPSRDWDRSAGTAAANQYSEPRRAVPFTAGPRVRIHFPPAASPLRT